jgi:hypothetical protein
VTGEGCTLLPKWCLAVASSKGNEYCALTWQKAKGQKWTNCLQVAKSWRAKRDKFYVLTCRRDERVQIHSLKPVIRTLISSMLALPSWLNHFLIVSCLNVITLVIKLQHTNFEGLINITAGSFKAIVCFLYPFFLLLVLNLDTMKALITLWERNSQIWQSCRQKESALLNLCTEKNLCLLYWRSYLDITWEKNWLFFKPVNLRSIYYDSLLILIK